MTKEEIFKKNFPEYVTKKDECLSPYWDLFSAGIECATYELDKGCIQTLTKENAELKENYRKRGEIICSLERQIRLHIHSDHLTTAKEIIKEYMRFEPMIGTCSFYSEEYTKTKKKAEQFLSEVEK